MPFTSTLQSFRLSRCIYITGSCNPSTFSSLKRIMAYTWARLWVRLLARLRFLSTSIHLILCCSCLFYHFNSGYLTASLNHPYWALLMDLGTGISASLLESYLELLSNDSVLSNGSESESSATAPAPPTAAVPLPLPPLSPPLLPALVPLARPRDLAAAVAAFLALRSAVFFVFSIALW